MSTPNRDARAVVAAVDRLTTQVKRLADAQSTPVAIIRDGVKTPVVGDPFPAGTCDASTLGVGDRHLGPCLLRSGHDGPVHRGPEGETWATVVATADDAPTTTADNAVTGCPTPLTHNWGCGCLSDPMAPVPDGPTRVHPAVYDAALRLIRQRDSKADDTDEDAQRTTRREQLHNLLARADRTTLTPGEADALRDLVDTEVRAADTARAVAAGNKRHVQLMHEEVQAAEERARKAERAADLLAHSHRRAEQAQAALDRVRAVVAGIAHPTSAGIRDYDLGRQEMATAVIVALTDTDQPTTKEN